MNTFDQYGSYKLKLIELIKTKNVKLLQNVPYIYLVSHFYFLIFKVNIFHRVMIILFCVSRLT